MGRPILELDGTWEEIAARAAELAGRRLHVTVWVGDGPQAAEDPRLAVLREIDARCRQMSPLPDDHDFVREGRSGGMFG